MSKQWSGEAELQGLLVELCGHATVPLSKVKQIVTTCNKYVADFKMVVYEIERFIKKANAEDKLAGVYVVDSLCRQHTKEREVFVKRFSIRLRETMSYLQKVPPQDRATLIRLLEEWRKKSVFGPDSLGQILGDYGVAASSSGAMLSPSKGDTDESGKKRLASGAGFVESDVKKATRLCPFREGNCPYGDKCRFDHHGTNTLEQYAARLLKPLVANQQPTAVTVISSDNGERVLNPLQSAIANGSATEETPSESVLDPKFWERSIIRRLHDPNPKDNDEEVPLPSILPTSELKFYRQKSSSAQNEPLPLMVMMANPALSSALPTEYYEISRDSLIDLYVANAAPPKAV